eukprot:365813-Chlamydomonas_euryale.AAC.20
MSFGNVTYIQHGTLRAADALEHGQASRTPHAVNHNRPSLAGLAQPSQFDSARSATHSLAVSHPRGGPAQCQHAGWRGRCATLRRQALCARVVVNEQLPTPATGNSEGRSRPTPLEFSRQQLGKWIHANTSTACVAGCASRPGWRGGPIGASKVCPAQARPGVSSTGVKSTGVPSIDETSTVANVAGQLRGPPLQQAGGQAGRMAAARQAALPLPLRLLRRLLRLPTRRRARGHTGARACLERGRLPRRHGLPTRQVWMRQVWVRLQLLVQHLHVGLGDNLPHRGVKHQVGASLAAHRLGGGGRVGVGNHPQPRAPVPHPAARVELGTCAGEAAWVWQAWVWQAWVWQTGAEGEVCCNQPSFVLSGRHTTSKQSGRLVQRRKCVCVWGGGGGLSFVRCTGVYTRPGNAAHSPRMPAAPFLSNPRACAEQPTRCACTGLISFGGKDRSRCRKREAELHPKTGRAPPHARRSCLAAELRPMPDAAVWRQSSTPCPRQLFGGRAPPHARRSCLAAELRPMPDAAVWRQSSTPCPRQLFGGRAPPHAQGSCLAAELHPMPDAAVWRQSCTQIPTQQRRPQLLFLSLKLSTRRSRCGNGRCMRPGPAPAASRRRCGPGAGAAACACSTPAGGSPAPRVSARLTAPTQSSARVVGSGPWRWGRGSERVGASDSADAKLCVGKGERRGEAGRRMGEGAPRGGRGAAGAE